MTSSPLLPAQAPAQTSGLAIGSMICGILGFLTFGVTGLPAVILGHIGLSQIKKAGGALKGTGLAITGLVTGYITVLIVPIAALAGLAAPMIVRQREAADRAQMMNHMRQMGVMFMEFELEYGIFPSDASAAAVATDTGADVSRLSGPYVLNQLEARGSDLESLLTVRSSAEGNWIYFPGHKTSDADYSQPILVSPVIRGEAMVLRLDSSVTTVGEPELGRLRNSSDAVAIPAPRR